MSDDYSSIQIESSLPKSWEEETTFNDILYDWMSRAPWLAISAAAHVVVFLILMAIPWGLLYGSDTNEIQASIEQTPEEIFEDPEEEPEEEIEEEPIEEPILQDAEVSDHNETEDDQDWEEALGEDQLADSPFDDKAFNDVIGIGGGAGGKFGNRFGGRRNLRAAGGSGTEQALKDGLEWLKHHQAPDGSWDTDNFMTYCGKIGSSVCDGEGQATHDVGMTGLALLAFLGDGNTTRQGPYKDVVSRGVKWLKDQQDPDNGLLGDLIGHSSIYNHAIATLAICETYVFTKSPLIKRTAQKAVDFILAARNPYSAWRYDYPPTGENDTSVTGWMVFALASAKDGGLKIDPDAFEGAVSWFDEVTEPSTGRTGYDTIGSASSRTTMNEHFPTDKGEAMTAVTLLCRFFLQQNPDDNPIMDKQAELLKQKLPEWDPDGLGNDIYYWYYGSYAMFQMGGSKYWKPWNSALKKAVLDSQRKDGDEKGSWDPDCAWGYAGGRVYSTAAMVLCLEVYFRYAQVLGAR